MQPAYRPQKMIWRRVPTSIATHPPRPGSGGPWLVPVGDLEVGLRRRVPVELLHEEVELALVELVVERDRAVLHGFDHLRHLDGVERRDQRGPIGAPGLLGG